MKRQSDTSSKRSRWRSASSGRFSSSALLAHLAQIAIFDSVPLGAERSKEAIELAQRHGWADDPVTGVAYAIHGIALVVQGRLAEAESWLQHAEAYAPALGLTRWRADALRDARAARGGERR